MAKTKQQKLRDKADKLLTPLIKAMHPRCLLCNNVTEVAHHHVHKSKSNALRYELDNLIPLCHHCHRVLHHNESYWASKIVSIKGLEWFERLEKIKNTVTVKADTAWYEGNLKRLEKLSTE